MDSKVYSISELTRRIRATLERAVGAVWIEGEISNLSYHQSGHVYLTLKDDQSQISAVMFRNEASHLKFRLKDGMSVQGFGRITVYERRGNYQIILETLQPAGVGNLQAAFEALKKKLQTEGLFDAERKRPLPIFPQTVGVVTSPTGAAVKDFCKVLHRRFPGVRIIIAPTAVQGNGAAQEIAAAIDLLNVTEASGVDVHIDVIAIIRGGGSIEDLWAFNEEVVARAVARSKIPTISGIGHEVDFTICDFVADLRAPTPSAAAELLIQPRSEFLLNVLDLARSIQRTSRLALQDLRHRLSEAREGLRLHEPRTFVRERRQRLDEASTTLRRETHRLLNGLRRRWHDTTQDFSCISPMLIIQKKKAEFLEVRNRFQQNQTETLTSLKNELRSIHQRLELLNPKATLQRGYSITLDPKSKKVIRSIKDVSKNQSILTQLADGEIQSVVD